MDEMKLMLTESQDLKFDLNVEGADPDSVNFRLILHENDFNIMFDGELQKDGEEELIVFKLPEMKNIIKSDRVLAEVEILVNDMVLNPSPWKKYIKIERPVEVKINESKRVVVREEPKKPVVKIKETKKPEVDNRIKINIKSDVKNLVSNKITEHEFKKAVFDKIKESNVIGNKVTKDTKQKLIEFKKSSPDDKMELVNEIMSVFASSKEFKETKLIVN